MFWALCLMKATSIGKGYATQLSGVPGLTLTVQVKSAGALPLPCPQSIQHMTLLDGCVLM